MHGDRQPQLAARQTLTQELQLAPELALLTANTIHNAGYVLEGGLQLFPQCWCILALPQPPLVEWDWACLEQRLTAHLMQDIHMARKYYLQDASGPGQHRKHLHKVPCMTNHLCAQNAAHCPECKLLMRIPAC